VTALRLVVHPEVQAALAEGRGVVALESTLLAHGLPPARRAEAAARLEATVRREGAVPATIAILDGVPHVGLDADALARITQGGPASGPRKAALRDLAIALATGGDWATTVSTTMALAARAGVRCFATGGIGGVHREVLETFDESSDLVALARYPVLVVSAGAKSVLDLPRTAERLETLGVPIVGFGTRELPAFYHGRSGVPLEHATDDVATLARIAHQRFDVLGEGGVLVVQPPPAALAQDPTVIDGHIDDALAEANARGIRGARITPFLLAELAARSSGSTVETNLALVDQNAQLAARVAVAYAGLTRR
jgi:pseudouridine-5'-phosphate glycosidase